MGRKREKKPKPRGYWTKERVIEQAKKYGTLREWRKNCAGSYRIATKNGWYKEIRERYLTRAIPELSKDQVLKEASKYNRKTDFFNKNRPFYEKAKREGWLNECCAHMMTTRESFIQGRVKWTKESVLEEVKKYTRLNDLKYIGGLKYAINRLNLNDEVKEILIHGPKVIWTYDALKKEALKYNTMNEFEKNNGGACRKIYQLNLKEELCSHMKTFEEQITKWTHEKLIEVILDCQTKETLKKTHSGAYFRYKQNPELYEALFIKDSFRIEEELLHPKIKKIFKKYKIRFSHEKRFQRKRNSVRPDFIFEKNKCVYIVEAKTSGCYRSTVIKELNEQVLDQRDYVSEAYKDKIIIHIVLSEEGLIKSKETDYNMSLKEFDYFLRTGKYKSMPIEIDRHTHLKLSAKIRKEYFKKFR